MRLFIFSVIFIIANNVLAADTARDRLNEFANHLDSVKAHFNQSVTDTNAHPGDESQGTLALQAPRQFRWETIKPYQQLIVADGNHVWIYDPDLEQATVRNQGVEEAHSPLTVLTDLSQLDREFTQTEAGERDGLLWLKLTSKAKEPEFEYAELGFSAQSLERMIFKDSLGNTTQIHFSNWERNPKLAAKDFKFTPPKGVDVIGDAASGAEVYPIKN